MNKQIQSLTNKFIEKPGYLDKGAGYLAEVFKTTTKNIYAAKDIARKKIHDRETEKLHRKIREQEVLLNQKVNTKGECEMSGLVPERVKTLDDLIRICKIDTTIWEIVSWECNKWEVGRKEKVVEWQTEKGVSSGKVNDTGRIYVEPLFQVKCKLQKLSAKSTFQKEFKAFLADYIPVVPLYSRITPDYDKEKSILVLPKQDAHFNRVDFKGKNDIQARFNLIEEKTMEILTEASALNQLDKITYIVGSDQFNSEFNGLTTGGTPQQNLLSYREAFKLICNHEITVIENLINHCNHLELLFVPGNHDAYAGWHLINWLECYYRGYKGITVTEGDPEDPRKYERYSNTGIMYDHGAKLNGKELAQRFPMEFKHEWSNCKYFYIFSGDKHHELSLDVQGIKYYRVPALTPTKSAWEHKSGYITPGEMQAFLIRENKGLTNMYSRMLE